MKQIRNQISLNGEWLFCLDPYDELNTEGSMNGVWSPIQVPGSWEEQGYGEPSEHDPIGTWKKIREYAGGACYHRTFCIPVGYYGNRFQLRISGVHWFSEIWIDKQFVGKGESLVTEHSFDITDFIRAGAEQEITIRVDNRIKIPLQESHIHSYHTATNWGGITGGIRIETCPSTHISDLKIYPDALDKTVKVEVLTVGLDKKEEEYKLSVHIHNEVGEQIFEKRFHLDSKSNTRISIHLDEQARLWDDIDPYLYRLKVSLLDAEEIYDVQERRFGLRTIHTKGNQILLNGVPIFLRGYVDCCIFPQTGYPVWDVEQYRQQFKIAKQYGFNHVRLHGWTAPAPFWEAADEEGMLVQTELPNWTHFYMKRDEIPQNDVHQYLLRELDRVIRSLNHHPSFVMLSPGNELISEEGHEALNELVRHARKLDSTRLYTDNTGYGELPALDREGDYYITTLNWHPPYKIEYAATPDSSEDYNKVTQNETKPIIAHEHGQFTMYVRPSEALKYRGVLRPSWLDTINRTLEAKGLTEQVGEFIKVSGQHLVRSLREALERARRTKGLSGIQLLDIRDFPGQGHATTGVLDVFWDSKGLIEPTEFATFNASNVLLMRSQSRTFYAGDSIDVTIELSNYGIDSTEESVLEWELIGSDGIAYDSGTKQVELVPRGYVEPICRFKANTPIDKAVALLLKVQLHIGNEKLQNEWEFWALPRPKLETDIKKIWTNVYSLRSSLYGAVYKDKIGIHESSYRKEYGIELAITDHISRDILQFLVDGGSVWLHAKKGRQHDEVMTRYLPIFWNYLWFPTQKGTTMGMLIHEHPTLGEFPHDGISNWLWYHLVDQTVALGVDQIPHVRPIVEVIDNFNRCKRLAYAYEVNVGKGKLFVSTLRLSDANDLKNPESNYLLHQIIQYLMSDTFQPIATITVGDILSLFKLQ